MSDPLLAPQEVLLVLGTAQLRSAYGILAQGAEDPSSLHAHQMLQAAAELGIDALDTAPAYGGAEQAIGDSKTELAVHTKIDPMFRPEDSLAGSLARLRRDDVAILYLHDSAEVLRPRSSIIADAFDLVGSRAGLLGASTYDTVEFDAAVNDPRIKAIQAPLNVLDRRIGLERLRLAARSGVAVYARSVLLQGLLAAAPAALRGPVEPLRPYVERFQRIAKDVERSPLELALGWVKQLDGLRGVVVGADSVASLRELHAAFHAGPLSAEELSRLDDLETSPSELCDPRRWKRHTA